MEPSVDTLLSLGLAEADSALALDARSSDGWMARGFLLEFSSPGNFSGVLPALERAVALDPRNAEAWYQYSWALLCLGRDSAGVAASLRALELEPGRPITLYTLALERDNEGKLAEARRWTDSVLAVDPTFLGALAYRSAVSARVGDVVRARADAEAGLSIVAVPDLKVTLAILAARSGELAIARATMDSLTRANTRDHRIDWRLALSLGRGYVGLGDTAAALSALERGVPRGLAYGFFLRSPDYDVLRRSVRFERLIRSMSAQP